jgi:hypothetical protein
MTHLQYPAEHHSDVSFPKENFNQNLYMYEKTNEDEECVSRGLSLVIL